MATITEKWWPPVLSGYSVGALYNTSSFSRCTTGTPTPWTAMLRRIHSQRRIQCCWMLHGTGPGSAAVLKSRVQSSLRNGQRRTRWDCTAKKWMTSPERRQSLSLEILAENKPSWNLVYQLVTLVWSRVFGKWVDWLVVGKQNGCPLEKTWRKV